MVEFDRKRNFNRECQGAFRRGEVQTNNKLWMALGSGDQSLIVKLPRKNIVGMLEKDQVRLNEVYDKNRNLIKAKVRELNSLGPDMVNPDMDPYVLELLMREQKPKRSSDDESD